MRQLLIVVAATASLFAICAALTTSQSTAEPISGADTVMDPWNTATRTQDTAEAEARFEQRDYDGALRLLRDAARNDVDLPPAQVIMAQLFSRADMPTEAKKALEHAIVDAPGDPEPYVAMAGLVMEQGDVSKAESLFQKANGLMAGFDKSAKRRQLLQPAIYSGLAAAAEARGDWPGAQRELAAWVKLDPNNVTATQRLGYCLFQQKNVDGALEMLRRATKSDREALTAEALLAQFCQRSGDRENAAKWMAAALVAAPKNLQTRLAAGRMALDMGQLDEAQKHGVAAMQINPKSSLANFFRGLVALLQRDYSTAESHFDAALKQSPRNAAFSNNLALSLSQQDDETKKRRALELAEANARRYPKSPEASSTHGWVLYRLGQLDDAEKALATAIAAPNPDADSAYIIARVSAHQRRNAEAKRMLESALKSTRPFMFQQDAVELLGQLKR